jgi:hypothetical protein
VIHWAVELRAALSLAQLKGALVNGEALKWSDMIRRVNQLGRDYPDLAQMVDDWAIGIAGQHESFPRRGMSGAYSTIRSRRHLQFH